MDADIVRELWARINRREWDELAELFHPNAVICWPNTDECFSPDRFAEVNRHYPSRWAAEVERMYTAQDGTVITVTLVSSAEAGASFYATSFFTLENKKISALTEYWGENGPPPQWRAIL